MPMTSVMLMMRRDPSLKRDACTSTWTALAICWRMEINCMFALAIDTITSRRRDGVARAVGVDRGQRSVVTGVHRLQHVQRFLAADFADDDAVGTHTQAVDQQFALADGAVAFEVRRTGFQARHVRLLQLQFGRVFDGDDAFFRD